MSGAGSSIEGGEMQPVYRWAKMDLAPIKNRKVPSGKPWYEIVVTVNDKEVYLVTEIHDDPLGAIQEATDLIVALKEEQDVGSWSVTVLPHWCDKNDCECSKYRRSEIPQALFKGMTLAPDFN
jgi:hypothetical protein